MSFIAEYRLPKWECEDILLKALKNCTSFPDGERVFKKDFFRPDDERLYEAVNSINPLIKFSQEQYMRTRNDLIKKNKIKTHVKKVLGPCDMDQETTVYDFE